jgi:hypothetical protein
MARLERQRPPYAVAGTKGPLGAGLQDGPAPFFMVIVRQPRSGDDSGPRSQPEWHLSAARARVNSITVLWTHRLSNLLRKLPGLRGLNNMKLRTLYLFPIALNAVSCSGSESPQEARTEVEREQNRQFILATGASWLVGRWSEDPSCGASVWQFARDGGFWEGSREVGTWRLGGNRLIISRRTTTTVSTALQSGEQQIILDGETLVRCPDAPA